MSLRRRSPLRVRSPRRVDYALVCAPRADREPTTTVILARYSGRMTTAAANAHLYHWVVTLSCIDGPGIVHAISGAIVAARGNITESQQFASLDTGTLLHAPAGRVAGRSRRVRGGARARHRALADDSGTSTRSAARCAPSCSRRPPGHCVNDLLFRQRAGQLPIEIPLVLSNHGTLRDLVDFYGVPFESAAVTDAASKAAFEQRVLAAVDEHDIELVVLARYMQILSPELCDALAGRCINIHHSFLPGLQGREPVPAGARPRREAHRRDRALRDERPRRGADHRAERRARRPLAQPAPSSSRSARTKRAAP